MRYLICLFTLIAISCSSDDNGLLGNELNGQWEMTSYISLIIVPIESDQIYWTFDVANEELNVLNKNEEEYPFALLSGSYDIELRLDKIIIESIEFDYLVEDGILSIANKPELDGPIISFKRN